MNKYNIYYGQYPTGLEWNSIFSRSEESIGQAVKETVGSGVSSIDTLPYATGTPDKYVHIPIGSVFAPETIDVQVGASPSTLDIIRHTAWDSILDIDITISVGSEIPSAGNKKYMQVYINATRNPSEDRTDEDGVTIKYYQEESYEIIKVFGAESANPSKLSIATDKILMFEVLLNEDILATGASDAIDRYVPLDNEIDYTRVVYMATDEIKNARNGKIDLNDYLSHLEYRSDIIPHSINSYNNVDQYKLLPLDTSYYDIPGDFQDKYISDMVMVTNYNFSTLNSVGVRFESSMPTGFESYGKSINIANSGGDAADECGFIYPIFQNGVWAIENEQVIMGSSIATMSLFVKPNIGPSGQVTKLRLFKDGGILADYDVTGNAGLWEDSFIEYDLATAISANPTSTFYVQISMKGVSSDAINFNATMFDVYAGKKRYVWRSPVDDKPQCKNFYKRLEGARKYISSVKNLTTVAWFNIDYDKMAKTPAVSLSGTVELTDYIVHNLPNANLSDFVWSGATTYPMSAILKFTHSADQNDIVVLEILHTKYIELDANIYP